ncbi:hypothetical protein QBC43DRAFT_270142 [Cladorrhinum sp. PSN259]|nr:hypothetical protein QBC43DRAFT_270142 [Cladorrhinum sp. PSN259]
MDFLNKVTGGSQKQSTQDQTNPTKTTTSNNAPTGGGGGLMDKFNSMAGGGKQSEKNEDAVDKGVDLFQQHVLGQGDQSNESAIEQAKDEQISDFIRKQYKGSTGSDLPVADK